MKVKRVFTYDFPNCNSEKEIREYVLNDAVDDNEERKKLLENFSLSHLFWFLDLNYNDEEWFIEVQ